MGWFRRMMSGRYGMDQLNTALLGSCLCLRLLSVLSRAAWPHWLSTAVAVPVFLRMFSRQIGKRRAENEKFLALAGPLIRKYNVWRCRHNDREHTYFRCPGCGQQLRVPKGKGKILVTCRACGAAFEKKT